MDATTLRSSGSLLLALVRWLALAVLSVATAGTLAGPTTTTLTSSINPSNVNQATILTAVVTGNSPSGTITFKSGTTVMGTVTVNPQGASSTLSKYFPQAGARNLTATYSGDANNSPSTSAVVVQTVRAITTTTLSSTVNPSYVDQTTTFKATISGGANYTGSVTFKSGTTTMGTAPVSSGVASFDKYFPAAGTRNIVAIYAGNSTNTSSTSAALPQTVNDKISTNIGLASNANPAVTGQNIVLTATVTPSDSTGTVTVKEGSTTLGSGSLSAGVATINTSLSTVGSHSLVVTYNGDTGHAVSSSSPLNQIVSPAGPLPTPPTSPTPVVHYQYDAQGNPTVTTVAPGNSAFNLAKTTEYDALNRAKKVTDPGTAVVQFGYDGLGRVISVVDPRSLTTQYPRDGLGQAQQVQSPDTGNALLAYDVAGNLTARTDSRGVSASYGYDPLDRLSTAAFSYGGNTQSFSWTYDQTGAGFSYGIGRLTTATFPEGNTRYAYDAQGRVLQSQQTVNPATGSNSLAVTRTVAYGYDAAGHVTSIVYPSGRKLTVGYANGLPTSISLAANTSATALPLLSAISYAPFGPAQSWSWNMASGTQAYARSFDQSGRLVRYPLGDYLRDVSYDAASRITGYTHYLAAVGATTGSPAPTLDQQFGYSATGRLTQATTAQASWTYAYDASGNRTSVTATPGGINNNTVAPTSNRITATGNPARTVTYDAMGNITSDGNYTLGYDLRGRMASVTYNTSITTYSYDNAGRRVRKFSNSGAASTVLFAYDLNDHLLGEYDLQGNPIREYVWLDDQPVAMFVTDPAGGANPPVVYYLFADHINTPRVAIDKAGSTRWTWMDEPFGTGIANSTPTGLASVMIPLRFPGQYFDAESGMHYNINRDYAPGMGRYAQSDPIGLQGGINTYAYGSGNPVSRYDPQGLADLNFFLPSSPLRQYGNAVSSAPGTYTVVGHGNAVNMLDAANKVLTPARLAELIKADPNSYGKTIEVYACNAGNIDTPYRRDGGSFGSDLARALGQPVRAPDSYVWFGPDGVTGIYPIKGLPSRFFGEFPDRANPGSMKAFKP